MQSDNARPVTPIGERTWLGLGGDLLRAPESVVAQASDAASFAWLAPRVLGIALIGAVVLGAVAGSYRGGVQIGFAAVKMPLLFLVPLVVALPAVRAVYGLAGVELPSRRLALAGLVAMARTSLVAAAMAPAVWLAYDSGLGYHAAIVALAGVLLLAGAAGLPSVAAVVTGRRTLATTAAALGSLVVLGLVTAQTGWVLRPFVARPTAEVTFVRPIEGDVFGSLVRAPLAAADVYLRYEPEHSPWRDRDTRDGGE